eukprot:scaffold32495_cov60-Phaeocystis_antarctica.AAC.12
MQLGTGARHVLVSRADERVTGVANGSERAHPIECGGAGDAGPAGRDAGTGHPRRPRPHGRDRLVIVIVGEVSEYPQGGRVVQVLLHDALLPRLGGLRVVHVVLAAAHCEWRVLRTSAPEADDQPYF